MVRRGLGLAAFAMAALASGSALACICMPYASAEAHLKDASVMFVGRATRSEKNRAGSRATTRFAVVRTLKGDARSVRWVAHDLQSSCATWFKRGETYVILAFGEEGRLGTGSCGQPLFPLSEYEKASRGKQ